ncbi:MAG: STAS domain-containing protein [Bacilli bacterium]|nr:STAS domain-containing protein [Bacilli bacterium]
MEVKKTVNGKEVLVAVSGSIDTTTAPSLEKEVEEYLNDADLLAFDLAKVDYVSSAGLRVLLRCHKAMMAHGKMLVKNVDPLVMDVFEMTGFTGILNIE